MKIKFFSGLREPEAKLILLGGTKTKPTMTIPEMTEKLQFRNQAMVFASFSIGNKCAIKLQKELQKTKWKFHW